MMKNKIWIIILLLGTTLSSNAQFVPQDKAKSVVFYIKNLGSKVDGELTGLTGNINFNPERLDTSNIKVAVNASTINTSNKARDKHLKKTEYFDAEKHTKLTIESKEIVKGNSKDSFYLKGAVTIKGVTKDIIIPFVVNSISTGLNFLGNFTINRRDFGVGKNSVVLADKVTITLNITAVKK
jgi:polyisoprenoid-binding protein YceI